MPIIRRPEDESCDTCRFWYPPDVNDKNLGACHRYPQHVIKSAEPGQPNAQWPRTVPKSWCGEWQSIITPEIVSEIAEWATKKPNALRRANQ